MRLLTPQEYFKEMMMIFTYLYAKSFYKYNESPNEKGKISINFYFVN